MVEEYTDVASGKNDRRESFQQLVTDARSKLFDVVVVYKYSRFARNDIDSVWYERELSKKGIDLVSATEVVDTTTSAGWLSKRIVQTFAEFENLQRSEFVKAAMRQKVLEGGWPWVAPLGFVNKNDAVNGRRGTSWVEPDPDTAPLVIRLFEEAATGRYSMPELCELAEEMGLKNRRGGLFTSERMLTMLKNPFYKGWVVSPTFDVEAPGVHEALVDDDLWQRVQLEITVRGKAPYRTQRHKHLLRGLVRCICSLAMTAEFHNGGRNAYLRCMSSANPRYDGCGQMGPRLDAVIAEIENDILPALWVRDEDLETIRDEVRGLLQKDHHALEAEALILRTRLQQMKVRSEALLDVRLDGEITKDEFQEKRAALELDQAKVAKRLDQVNGVITRGEEDLDEALGVANQLPALWAQADEDGRRGILEAVFVKFVVGDKRIVDVEVRAPFSWLSRWKGESTTSSIAANSTLAS